MASVENDVLEQVRVAIGEFAPTARVFSIIYDGCLVYCDGNIADELRTFLNSRLDTFVVKVRIVRAAGALLVVALGSCGNIVGRFLFLVGIFLGASGGGAHVEEDFLPKNSTKILFSSQLHITKFRPRKRCA